MTSRERILAAIEHRQPDRVPVDLGATPSSGISAIAYGNLKRHLGLTQGSTRVYDVVQQLAQPEDFILDRFGVDAIDIGRAFNREEAAWRPTTLADGQSALYPAWYHPERQPDDSYIARMSDGLDIAHMPAGGTFSMWMVIQRTFATFRLRWVESFGPRLFTVRGITSAILASGTRCAPRRWNSAAPATARS
jgi:uroporphyrinogen decarboxylase